MAFQTRKQLEECGDKIPADKRATIEAAITKLEEAHKAQDVDACNRAMKDIEAAFGAAQQDIFNAQQQAQQQAQNPGAGASQQSGPDDHVTDVDFEEVK